MWQALIGRELAAQLRADSEVLGLRGRTDIVKAALALLHQRAAEERMARSVDEFRSAVRCGTSTSRTSGSTRRWS